MTKRIANAANAWRPPRGDGLFNVGLGVFGGGYVLLVAAMLAADLLYVSFGDLRHVLADADIRRAVHLSLVAATASTLLSLWSAVPLGYLLSRTKFPLKGLVEILLDIPLVLPPLVVGLSLLILLQTPPGERLQRFFPIAYAVPGVILAQFAVTAAYAVRTMRVTFDQIDPRAEQVALTLGCSRSQAFWRVLMPDARRGVVAAATLSWARSLGEFGPVLVVAGSLPKKTVVLPTSVYFEMLAGRLGPAIAVSLLMMLAAAIVLTITRAYGLKGAV